jgi:hypothetical protein
MINEEPSKKKPDLIIHPALFAITSINPVSSTSSDTGTFTVKAGQSDISVLMSENLKTTTTSVERPIISGTPEGTETGATRNKVILHKLILMQRTQSVFKSGERT